MKLSKLVKILGNSKDEYVLHICNCNKEQFTSREYSLLIEMLEDPEYKQHWRKYNVYLLRDNHIYIWHPKIHITELDNDL